MPKIHTKDIEHKNKNGVLFDDSGIPLDKFRGQRQLLFSAIPKCNIKGFIDYKLCENSSVFLIDIRQFTKGLGLSVHICDYRNVNRLMNVFNSKPHHQNFVYWKSNPKIVLIAFDN